MKRSLPTLALVISFCVTAPSANAWWWSHHGSHNSPGPAGAGATSKAIKPKKEKRQKGTFKGEHLYNFPKSWGWFHKSPGPAGAGS